MSKGKPGTVLVTGAGGVIGQHVAAAYRADGAKVIGVSRTKPFGAPTTGYTHYPLDLLDQAAANAILGPLACEITHVVFGAYLEGQSLTNQVELNVALLRNTLDALDGPVSALRHLTLYQGSKAYGNHLGPIKTPTKETDPRLLGPHFYYDQEDLLRELSLERGFTFTILRPDLVIGYAYATPMNFLMAIAVYASICKELGLPLRFPGTAAAYHALIHCTDAELLAQATLWSGRTDAAANEIFNVTNGDQFRVELIWPAIARHFDLEIAPPVPMGLELHMADKGPIWERLTQRHDLRPAEWSKLVNWAFFDWFALNPNAPDVFGSTIKIRQAGFADCFDTEERFISWFDRLRAQRIIP